MGWKARNPIDSTNQTCYTTTYVRCRNSIVCTDEEKKRKDKSSLCLVRTKKKALVNHPYPVSLTGDNI